MTKSVGKCEVPEGCFDGLAACSVDLSVPMFVDLDGTLVRTDLLVESFLNAIRRMPLTLVKVPLWLLSGRAFLKSKLAEIQRIEIARLPFRASLCKCLRDQAARGRSIYLATASDVQVAEAVSAHLGFFKGVLASDGKRNLKGSVKLEQIRKISDGPFDYVGNGPEDLPIWREARKAILVQVSPRVFRSAIDSANVCAHIQDTEQPWRQMFRALRPHQWLKNLLIFVPLLTSLSFNRWGAWSAAILAAIAFCAVASATYIWNDLLDLDSDRAHPRKRFRPFASGGVMPQTGMAIAVALSLVSIVLAATLSFQFLVCLLLYFSITTGYSLFLKRYVLIDALTLAVLYSLRVIAGAAAIGVVPSYWLLAFCVFFFFSLALVKRCAELYVMESRQRTSTVGRDYNVGDADILRSLGTASGFSAIVIFSLYITDPQNSHRFSSPELLWFICAALLYWISRLWVKTARGEMHDDPLVFAARDRGSRWVVASIICCFVAAAIL